MRERIATLERRIDGFMTGLQTSVTATAESPGPPDGNAPGA